MLLILFLDRLFQRFNCWELTVFRCHRRFNQSPPGSSTPKRVAGGMVDGGG